MAAARDTALPTDGRALSASVVVYGDASAARRLLDSFARFGRGTSLYLVDNASPDGAMDALEAGGLPPDTTVLRLPQNRGFGAGHNACLALLASRYHAVINPDIVLRDDAVARMAAWMDEHPDVAITTPQLLFPDGRPQYTAKRRPAVLPLLARQLGGGLLKKQEDHYLMLDEDLSQPQNVEFCSGSFFVIRTEVLRAIGGFDEGYFMYVEDADITRKALQHGRAVFLPQVAVVHEWQRAAHRKPRQFFWQLRSMLRYFRKWGFRMR